MPYHHFHIGQQVVASAFGVPPGPYEILRLLPLADGIPHYRARSHADGHERALPEPSLRLAPKPANSNEAPLARPKSRAR